MKKLDEESKENGELPKETFDAIVLTVAHRDFTNLDFTSLLNEKSVIYDVKNSLSDDVRDNSL